MSRRLVARLACAAALAGFCAAAMAHGPEGGRAPGRTFEGPFVKGELEASLRADGPVATDSTANRASQLYLDDVNLSFGVFANDWLSLQANVKGEALRSLRPHRSAAFRGFGLFTEQLYLNADFEDFALFAGKIKPTFGYLWSHHNAPGLFSVDFTEDYETVDFIGAGLVLRGDFQDRGLGRHELTAQTFFADTTILHRSVITAPRAGGSTVERQSRLHKSDGGVGNTGKPNNFSVTLDSTGWSFLPEFAIHLGYRILHRSQAGVAAGTETRNEQGFGISFDYTATVTDMLLPGKTTIKPAIEWVRLKNFDGNPGRRTFWGANLGVNNGDWTWYLTGTLRNTDTPGVPKALDQLLATSLFFQANENWQIGIGYKYQRVRDETTGKNANDHVIGVKFAWTYDFSFGLK